MPEAARNALRSIVLWIYLATESLLDRLEFGDVTRSWDVTARCEARAGRCPNPATWRLIVHDCAAEVGRTVWLLCQACLDAFQAGVHAMGVRCGVCPQQWDTLPEFARLVSL